MPGQDGELRREKAIKRALVLATEALDLLDAHDGPPEAAAHIEMALQKLRSSVKDGRQP
jgi:hypothetical protein